MVGTVKRVSTDKGFGFIRPEGGSQDFFFHHTAAPQFNELREGSRVEFEEERSQKGPRATNVRLLL